MKSLILGGLITFSALLGGCTTYTQDPNGNTVAATVMPVPLVVADDYLSVNDGYGELPYWNSHVWNGENWNYNNGYYRANWNRNWNGNQRSYYYRGASGSWQGRRTNRGYTAWRGSRGSGGYYRR